MDRACDIWEGRRCSNANTLFKEGAIKHSWHLFFTVLHALGACILHLWRALYPRFKVLGSSAGMFIGVTPRKGPLH